MGFLSLAVYELNAATAADIRPSDVGWADDPLGREAGLGAGDIAAGERDSLGDGGTGLAVGVPGARAPAFSPLVPSPEDPSPADSSSPDPLPVESPLGELGLADVPVDPLVAEPPLAVPEDPLPVEPLVPEAPVLVEPLLVEPLPVEPLPVWEVPVCEPPLVPPVAGGAVVAGDEGEAGAVAGDDPVAGGD